MWLFYVTKEPISFNSNLTSKGEPDSLGLDGVALLSDITGRVWRKHL